ncbi:MAG TPA: hypothetical protein VNK43_13680 [Gemmatimonadales bacterium]|nr:hypothetical protein [Gemmatimonadales bacterium]
MRIARSLLLLALAAVPAGRAVAQSADRDKPVAGGGNLPAGWTARPDGRGSLANVKLVTMPPGYHVTLGPAAIFWREEDKVTGRFHTLATFTQTQAPAHPEGYGLFFNGKDLNGPNQHYVYFLVRGDGTFLIKRRDGDKTTNITNGWTAHPAINKADGTGKATNKLEIDGKASADKIRFFVNGKVVYEAEPSAMEMDGIVGFRVNHNLDVHIEGFDIHRM